MKKVKLGDLVIDLEEHTILKNEENQASNFKDAFKKGRQGWKILKHFLSHPNVEFADEYIVQNVMHSTADKAKGVITATISTLSACGLDEKSIFETRTVSDVRYYKFIGKVENLDIKEYKRVYFKKLYNTLGFEIRDERKGRKRKLWEFYINPSFKDFYTEEKSESPFSRADLLRSLIIAPSGIGKTTMLESVIALSINNFVDRDDITDYSESRLCDMKESLFGKNFKIYTPIYIKAKKVQRGSNDTYIDGEGNQVKKNLVYFAEPGKSEFSNDDIQAICKSANSEGTLLVLIDAIDEINSNKEYFYNLFHDFCSEYSNAKIVVTSRFVDEGIENLINILNFKPLRLCNFQKNDVLRLIELSKNDITDERAEAIKKRLETDSEFERFLSNAYCATSVITHKSDEDINQHFAKVIMTIADNILNFRCKCQNGTLNDYTRYLKKLAWSMVKNEKDSVIYREFLKILTSEKNTELYSRNVDAKKIVEDLSQISGILDQRNDIYIFQSELIMYYFAASYIIFECIDAYVEDDEDDVYGISYKALKSFVDIKTETGIKVLVFAISLSSSLGYKERSYVLYNYLISTIIFSNKEIDKLKEPVDGLKKLLNQHYGATFVNNSKNGKEYSIYQKIAEDILQEFDK